MPAYRVLIEFTNLPARLIEGSKSPVGFYATRFVEADDEAHAERAAIEQLVGEISPLIGKRLSDDPTASAHIDELEQVDVIPEDAPNSGATWFRMGN